MLASLRQLECTSLKNIPFTVQTGINFCISDKEDYLLQWTAAWTLLFFLTKQQLSRTVKINYVLNRNTLTSKSNCLYNRLIFRQVGKMYFKKIDYSVCSSFQAVTDTEKQKGMKWQEARVSEKLLPKQSVLRGFYSLLQRLLPIFSDRILDRVVLTKNRMKGKLYMSIFS